jgi:hypothetical protein
METKDGVAFGLGTFAAVNATVTAVCPNPLTAGVAVLAGGGALAAKYLDYRTISNGLSLGAAASGVTSAVFPVAAPIAGPIAAGCTLGAATIDACNFASRN